MLAGMAASCGLASLPLVAAAQTDLSPAADGSAASGYARAALSRREAPFTIDGRFPGGNVVVASISGDRVLLHQDLRDMGSGNWFYWNFRVKGAAGRALTFSFTHPWGAGRKPLNPIGVRGPAVSLDGGRTWQWLGAEAANGTSFTYRFPRGQQEARFSSGMPYVSDQFDAFMEKYRHNPHVEVNTLALTREGRRVERVHLGNLNGNPKYRVVLAARHHASEMTASYVLEGIMQYLLEDPVNGRWFREHGEALIIPFMDKDGVENGEQGKGRRGRDHNKDYSGTSIYSATAALRAYVPIWAAGKPLVGIDLHCPWIRGGSHERIHQVGHRDPAIWKQQMQFGNKLQTASAASRLVYSQSSDLAFGTSWNKESPQPDATFKDWLAQVDGARLATTLEIPFANASGGEVTQESARALGADVARALVEYLKELDGAGRAPNPHIRN